LADERITHPKQVVHEGQELILRIIRIDPQRRRMGLSLRRALDTPDAELEAVFGPGILEERDSLAQQIRSALEAEGIEPHVPGETTEETPIAATAETAQGESGEPSQQDVAAPESAVVPEAPTDHSELASEPALSSVQESEAAAVNDKAAEKSAAKSNRQRGSQRTRTDLPKELQDEPLSAMAMAFAMAAPELVVDEAGDESDESQNTADGDGGEGQQKQH
jgi:hypothetical protein